MLVRDLTLRLGALILAAGLGVASAEAAGCVVLAVPSEIEVPPAAGRTVTDTLLGIDVDALRRLAG